MWPLLKKQLHQGKVMRELQPQIKEIRKKNKGNRQKESQEMMALYKKHGVNPLGSIGLLAVQLPVFFGLFSALRSFISSPERLMELPYSFVRNIESVKEILASVAFKATEAIKTLPDADLKAQLFEKLGNPVSVDALHELSKPELNTLFNTTLTSNADNTVTQLVQGPFFDQHLFWFIDLSGRAISDAGIYLPVLLIAALAVVFQYLQTKQMTPQDKNKKSLKQIMEESDKSGKQPDQAEITAAVVGKMGLFFAPFIFIISATVPAGLALYFATSGATGYLQTRHVLNEDVEEMEEIADKAEKKKAKRKK